MAVEPQQILTSKGGATGKLVGISHLAMMCKDMDATVRFYRDVLGLRIIATNGAAPLMRRDSEVPIFRRQYFMEMPNGDGVTFYEIPDSPDVREVSPPIGNLWPGETEDPETPCKLDHFAFSVATREDLDWFANRLTEAGVEFAGPHGSYYGKPTTPYVYRIYFWDPSGNPLEIAYAEYEPDPSVYILDPEPVPALLGD